MTANAQRQLPLVFRHGLGFISLSLPGVVPSQPGLSHHSFLFLPLSRLASLLAAGVGSKLYLERLCVRAGVS